MPKPSDDEQDPDTHWWTGEVECSICEHTWTATVEISKEHDEPIVPLECLACGNMTGNPD